jgi:hypothetical protein
MKLFLSAFLLAAASAAFAQQSAAPAGKAVPQANATQLQDKATVIVNDLVAHKAMPMDQASCPLFLQSASVASAASFLPVDAKANSGGTLSLRFRNASGKAIRSASITAHLRIKTNLYDLDAHSLDLRLTLAGTQDLDKTLDQIQRIVLPQNMYLFGVAQVSLDQVSFADGSVWTAPAAHNACGTSGPAIDRIAR